MWPYKQNYEQEQRTEARSRTRTLPLYRVNLTMGIVKLNLAHFKAKLAITN